MRVLCRLTPPAILILFFCPIAEADHCPAGADQNTVFFVNGVNTDFLEARTSLFVLREELKNRIVGTSVQTACIHYELAYNPHESLFQDLREASNQILLGNLARFWRILSGLEPAPAWFQILADSQSRNIDYNSYVVDFDLQVHVAQYRAQISAGSKVIAVAHSQGNLYANSAFSTLSSGFNAVPPDTFAIVAVATPASFVAGSGPYTTLVEDFIWQLPLIPSPLIANATNGPACGFAWNCHAFVDSYLLGAVSGPQILDDIVAAIRSGVPAIQLSFSQRDYRVGTGALSLAVADFDGDGTPDVASANQVSASVSVLLNGGDGSFGPVMTYSTGPDPATIMAADFNKDSRQDLAVVSFGANTLSVFIGNGDGTFQPRVDFPTGLSPFSFRIANGDFNTDGIPDIAVTSVGLLADSVAVMIGQGDGSFALGTFLRPGTQQSSIVTADFDQDRKLDLAISGAGLVSIALGNGDGTFGSFQPVSSGLCGVTTLTATDLNRDAIVDLVGGEGICGTAVVMLGAGGGQFNTANILDTLAGALHAIVAGDFDLDGKNDLAMSFQGPSQFLVFPGNGDGTFRQSQAFLVGTNLSGLTSIVAADFNRDGKLDLVVADHFTSTVSVFLNTSQ